MLKYRRNSNGELGAKCFTVDTLYVRSWGPLLWHQEHGTRISAVSCFH